MSIADKLTQVAENVSKVYEAGKKSEYDAFWDAYQKEGANTVPAQFAGSGWTTATFKPKYDINPTNGYFLFYQNATRVDLPEWLSELGVELNTSNLTSAQYLFWNAQFTRIGEIDFRKLSTSLGHTSQAFTASYLITIDKLILRDDGTNTFATNMFQYAVALKNISFEGVIGYSIDFQYCPLTRESITNIIEHLSNNVTSQTITFKKSAKEAAFTDDEWAELTATKPNWTFSLI